METPGAKNKSQNTKYRQGQYRNILKTGSAAGIQWRLSSGEGLLYSLEMKFGRIKRQHGRVGGLDAILDRIVKNCPHVSRIVPGRIKVRRGKTPPNFRIQYPTSAGLKCLYNGTGTVQEVFLICSNIELTKKWLVDNELAEATDD